MTPPAGEAGRHCRGCGLSLSESAAFCPTCGVLVPARPIPAGSMPTAPPMPGAPPPPAGHTAQPPAMASLGNAAAPRRLQRRFGPAQASVVAAAVLVIAVIVMGALGASSYESLKNASYPAYRPPLHATLAQVQYFKAVGFSGDQGKTLVRWDRSSLAVGLSGSYTPKDARTVADALASINTAIGAPRLFARQRDPDIRISFVTHEAFVQLGEAPEVVGRCSVRSRLNDIESAQIHIDNDPPLPGYRTGIICHELGHSMGLNDTEDTTYDTEVMYGHSAVWWFSDLDLAALRMLYDPRLKPGETKAEAAKTLKRFAD